MRKPRSTFLCELRAIIGWNSLRSVAGVRNERKTSFGGREMRIEAWLVN